MRRDGGGIDERFTAYVRDRGDHLLRVAVLLTVDWHAAEDLVQASLVKLYRAWPRLDTDADPDAYLRAGAQHLIVELDPPYPTKGIERLLSAAQ